MSNTKFGQFVHVEGDAGIRAKVWNPGSREPYVSIELEGDGNELTLYLSLLELSRLRRAAEDAEMELRTAVETDKEESDG
jgi:hypothetical protein